MNILEKLENQLSKLETKSQEENYNFNIQNFIEKLNLEIDTFINWFDKNLHKKYNHKLVENHRNLIWRASNLLKKTDKKNKNFSIILPPPNVTGQLHLGHAWNNLLQDTIIRYKELNGFNTLFLPSMDHAGIATQIKVESYLHEKNISKHDLGYEKFIDEVWKWKYKYAKKIRRQWNRLGLLLNYSNECFTLDNDSLHSVNKAFIDMYNNGLIYKGKRAINWDCKLQTSLSNIEVITKTCKSKMYYLKYKFENSDDFLEVATTRIETLFSDVALAIHPRDNRKKKIINKFVINPLTNKRLPIICDKYIKQDFCTGIMKVSAHAFVDIDIIKKNNLQIIECIDKNGCLNSNAKKYKGMNRFYAREKIAINLQKKGLITKIEDIENNVLFSERSNTVIEILVSEQWYVKTKPLAKLVLKNLATKDRVKFLPPRFAGTLKTWMNKIEDWNISRQLWWGHKIPAWYKNKQIKVQSKSPGEGWVQDSDVLDTWFSSSLAPFSFLGWPKKNEDLESYYPTSLLVTAYDIIFFWVARMYFQGLYFKKQIPFKEVLIHGLIRDKKGNKMSKSLNNGIDPMVLIDKYGSDSLRWFLLTNSTPGQDLKYSEEKIESAWNFNNKIWNIARFIISNSDSKNKETLFSYDYWILEKLNILNKKTTYFYNKYDFHLASKYIHNFVYNEFSSWYIEMSKEKFNKKFAIKILSDFLIIIYPLLPFLSDYLYTKINNKTILNMHWPSIKKVKVITNIDTIIEIVTAIRKFMSSYNLSKNTKIYYWVDKKIKTKNINVIKKLTNATLKKNKDALFPLTQCNLYIKMSKEILKQEKQRIKKEINELQKEIIRSKKILSNTNFIKNATKEKVNIEKEKYANYKNKLNILLKKS